MLIPVVITPAAVDPTIPRPPLGSTALPSAARHRRAVGSPDTSHLGIEGGVTRIRLLRGRPRRPVQGIRGPMPAEGGRRHVD